MGPPILSRFTNAELLFLLQVITLTPSASSAARQDTCLNPAPTTPKDCMPKVWTYTDTYRGSVPVVHPLKMFLVVFAGGCCRICGSVEHFQKDCPEHHAAGETLGLCYSTNLIVWQEMLSNVVLAVIMMTKVEPLLSFTVMIWDIFDAEA